jgi:hypothetical protein
MDSNIDAMSIIELLEILDIQHDELISRTTINEIIRNKVDATSNKNKKQLLQRIYTRLNKYLDDLGLNTIFRVDDLSLNKNLIDRSSDQFVIENQGMSMQNTFIHTVADGELNPLKKRTKAYILHLNTKHREKNSPDLYDKQLIKSVKNTRHTNKIQQLLNNMININSIIITEITQPVHTHRFTLLLDVDIPADFTDTITDLSFIFSEEIKQNNIFIVEDIIHVDDTNNVTRISNRQLSFDYNVINENLIQTLPYIHNVDLKYIPYKYLPDYGNNEDGTPITQTQFDAWQAAPDATHPYNPDNRDKKGLPPVHNYGERRVYQHEPDGGNKLTFTNYGNYERNSVAVLINSGETPLLSQRDVENKKGIPGIYKEPNTDFTINLSTIFNNVIKMSMESFAFTNSIYTFSSARKNNYFEILYNDADLADTGKITIPDGTYTAEQLVRYLNQKTNAVGGGNFFVRYSKITGKIFFYDITPTNFVLIFGTNTIQPISSGGADKINKNVEKNAGWMMGFKRSYYESVMPVLNPPTPAAAKMIDKILILNDANNSVPAPTTAKNLDASGKNHYVEAESIYNEDSNKTMFLVVDDFNYNHYNNHYNSFDGNIISTHILAKIQLKNNNANNFSFIHDMVGDMEYRVRDYFGPVDIERLHIKLIDEEGEPININETDYNLTLRFDAIHDI